MNIAHQLRPLQDFRDRLHFLFPQRADALFDLLDALSSNQTARSPAELSLNPLFRRTYNSVYDGIQSLRGAPVCDPASVAAGATFHQQVTQLIGARLPQPTRRPFWLFGVDVTPTPRPYARTLADRTFVYQPNPIGANKPVTVGHAYSVVAALPEKATHETPSWVVPLTTERVASTQTAVQVGVAQTQRLLNDPALPFHHALCVEVADSAYGGPGFLSPLARQPNLVVVARARNNRVFYRAPPTGLAPVGHPTWYGDAMGLNQPTTWTPPDEVQTSSWTTRHGKTFTVRLEAWYDLRMRGHRDQPMHDYPFTLMRVQLFDATGLPLHARPLWLVACGARRRELTLVDLWQAYQARYDLEHYFRFGKQRLLTTAYQTPAVPHEENWWRLTQLAYVQLWLVRDAVTACPRPWERSQPVPAMTSASPSTAQRRFAEIVRQIGTPAAAPKPRGNPRGRATGTRPAPRPRQPVVKKGQPAAVLV